MSKDPAVLFYTSDFIIGTAFLSHEQVGKYIQLLCYQHQIGRMNKEQVLKVTEVWDQEVMSKFLCEDGLYYNNRMEIESNKRKAFCESRRLSRMSNVRKTHVPRTVNENEDVNDNTSSKTTLNINTKYDFESLWLKYPRKVGKFDAQRHFKAQVKTQQDYLDIGKALDNFLKSGQVTQGDPKFIPHGSTWFNNRWRDYINWTEDSERKTDEHGVPLEWCTKKGLK